MSSQNQPQSEIDDLIDELIAFDRLRAEWLKKPQVDEASEFVKRVNALHEKLTPGAVTNLVVHYEKRLIKLEAESGRFALMKQAMREVMEEQRSGS